MIEGVFQWFCNEITSYSDNFKYFVPQLTILFKYELISKARFSKEILKIFIKYVNMVVTIHNWLNTNRLRSIRQRKWPMSHNFASKRFEIILTRESPVVFYVLRDNCLFQNICILFVWVPNNIFSKIN